MARAKKVVEEKPVEVAVDSAESVEAPAEEVATEEAPKKKGKKKSK